MNSYIPAIMEAVLPHSPKLFVNEALWRKLLADLYLRTNGRHESGAFLLGRIDDEGRRVEDVVFYDDLDADAYRSGVVVMHAASFGPLWDICRARRLAVVADVHVHPEGAWQSLADRENPMIAQHGHLALIVPAFARPPACIEAFGFYEYLGGHRWRNLSGKRIRRFLQIGE